MAKTEIIKRPIEEVGGDLKKSAWGAVVESIATIVLGLFLVIWPNEVIRAVAYVVGAFFIIKGAYQIINYFLVNGQNDFFNNNLLGGVISLLIGITLLIIGEEIANVFRIVIGIYLIYEALVRINTAIKLHAASIAAWKYVLILALMMLVVGVFVVFYSGAVATLIGWMMILAGIIGIIGDVMFVQYINIIMDKLIGKTEKNEDI
ncbi:DUF308 domain-containing protein [Candidatus Saccharibacteria bacterium]|nr:DUF308 domain-containing protein [Candidatus Saccharibacteria bacterium]